MQPPFFLSPKSPLRALSFLQSAAAKLEANRSFELCWNETKPDVYSLNLCTSLLRRTHLTFSCFSFLPLRPSLLHFLADRRSMESWRSAALTGNPSRTGDIFSMCVCVRVSMCISGQAVYHSSIDVTYMVTYMVYSDGPDVSDHENGLSSL